MRVSPLGRIYGASASFMRALTLALSTSDRISRDWSSACTSSPQRVGEMRLPMLLRRAENGVADDGEVGLGMAGKPEAIRAARRSASSREAVRKPRRICM